MMQKENVKEVIENLQIYLEKAKAIILFLKETAIKRIQSKPINEFRLSKKELEGVMMSFDIVIKLSNKLIDDLKKDKELSGPIKESAMDLAATEREFSIEILSKIDSLTILEGKEAFDVLEKIYRLMLKYRIN